MTDSSTGDGRQGKSLDPAAELNALTAKREAIRRVIEIGQAIERLQQSLEAVLLMGKPTRDIPAKALRAFEELNTQTKIMPTDKVIEGMHRLEKGIQQRLEMIMEIAEGGEEKAAELPDTSELLEEFRRKSQTAVALRILLRERGVPTKPTEISVPTSLLREQMSALEQREARCRTRIKDDLTDMRLDVERILNSDNCPASIRTIVEGVRDEIDLNLSYIASGKTIASMPMAIDIVEVGEEASEQESIYGTHPEAATSEPAAAPAAAQASAITTEPPAPAGTDVETMEVRRGLIERLVEWLRTPWGYKWSDISKTKTVQARKKD